MCLVPSTEVSVISISDKEADNQELVIHLTFTAVHPKEGFLTPFGQLKSLSFYLHRSVSWPFLNFFFFVCEILILNFTSNPCLSRDIDQNKVLNLPGSSFSLFLSFLTPTQGYEKHVTIKNLGFILNVLSSMHVNMETNMYFLICEFFYFTSRLFYVLSSIWSFSL